MAEPCKQGWGYPSPREARSRLRGPLRCGVAYTVFFGVHREHTPEPLLLEALGKVARELDASPTSLLCLLAEPTGDVTWFSFVCSALGSGRVMSAGFFRDVLAEALPAFAMHQRFDLIPSDCVLSYYRQGERHLEVFSDGAEVVLAQGDVPSEVPREGDAVHFGLRALGWPTEPTWETLGRVIELRRNRVPVEPLQVAERWTASARLPPIKVVRGLDEAGIEYWRQHAKERFRRTALSIARAVDQPLQLQLKIGQPGQWPDLSAVACVTGRIYIVDSWDPARKDASDWGLRVVDLGAVRELKYPCSLCVTGMCERVVGVSLEKADTIVISGRGHPRVELPRLRSLGRGSFGDPTREGAPMSEVELPALEEVKSVRFVLPNAPFVVRLPRLRKGRIILHANAVSDDRLRDSVLEIPALSRSGIDLLVPGPAEEATLRRLLGAGPPERATGKRAKAKAAAPDPTKS